MSTYYEEAYKRAYALGRAEVKGLSLSDALTIRIDDIQRWFRDKVLLDDLLKSDAERHQAKQGAKDGFRDGMRDARNELRDAVRERRENPQEETQQSDAAVAEDVESPSVSTPDEVSEYKSDDDGV